MTVKQIQPTPSAHSYPLLIGKLLDTPLIYAPDQEIIYRDQRRYDYRTFGRRVKQLAAMLARQGCMDTLVADVNARATGGGVGHSAIFLEETAADVTLQQVTALAENASSNNTGLVYYDADGTRLLGGSYTARGGEKAWAIFARYGGGTLVAEGISALAENATQNNTAMYPYDGAEVILLGGDFVARGGAQTNGIADQLNATVTAYDVTALAENAVDNYGLGSFDGSSMTVRGATVIARGGTYCEAVGTSYNGSTLDAESVVGLAEDCSGVNYGLYVGADTAHATVRGGSYTGRGATMPGGSCARRSTSPSMPKASLRWARTAARSTSA